MKIGVISDTHGLLRDEVIELLQDCDYIIHGGDIGDKEIISNLEKMCTTIVVKGNNDNEEWAKEIPERVRVTIDGINILVLHEIKKLPRYVDNVDLIIYGHSHKYSYEKIQDIVYLNPGSCGKKRFSLPLSMAIITTDNGEIKNINEIIL